MLRALGLIAAVALQGCGDPIASPSGTLEVRRLTLPSVEYGSLAWFADGRLAAAYRSDSIGISLIDLVSGAAVSVTPPVRSGCEVLDFSALGRSPDDGVGFAARCGLEVGADFWVLGSDGEFAESGRVQGEPFDAAWAPDGSITYSTGDVLCSTLGHLSGGIATPLPYVVEVGGESFAVGQDVGSSPGRCAVAGRAGSPSIDDASGSLAFLASSNGGRDGQAMLDRPWTLFVVEAGTPAPVLSGITDPRDIAWAADGSRILVAGAIDGRLRIWSIHRDGTGLQEAADLDALELAVSPDGQQVAAILSPQGGDLSPMVTFRLPN